MSAIGIIDAGCGLGVSGAEVSSIEDNVVGVKLVHFNGVQVGVVGSVVKGGNELDNVGLAGN